MDISFQGNKIGTASVLKKELLTSKYSPKQVALVEFDFKSKDDLKTLKVLKKDWNGFASDIYREAEKGYADSVYALTTQKDTFEKITPQKVLGLAEVVNIGGGNISLEYLQTKPNYIFDDDKIRKIKHIGKALIDSLKSKENVKSIQVNPLHSVIDFYKKQGFVSSNKADIFDEGLLIWKKQF